MMDNLNSKIVNELYYEKLCSSGLLFVQKQPQQIEQQRQNLIDNKRKIVYNNYDVFLKISNFNKEIINDLQTLEHCMNDLNEIIPEFKEQCSIFSDNSETITDRWNNVSLMLIKYPQMIEFMEIPQLLNNCIRTYYYDDAIKICNHVNKLCSKHSKDSIIFQNMMIEVDKCKDVMVAQILRELSGNIQLPSCIKMIKYLRQIERFNEDELRINFLNCRDAWFQSDLNKEIDDKHHSLNQINHITESFRVNIFDIVTQYQAIFPELNKSSIIESSCDDKDKLQSKIINSWLLIKIEQYLHLLRKNLSSCLNIKTMLYIDPIIDNCFYFGLSMNKIGADIRPQLILIFNDFIHKRFEFYMNESTKQFCNSLDEIFTLSQFNNNQVKAIENHSILMKYQTNLSTIFHEIRNNVPLSLISKFVKILNQSLIKIMDELKSFIKKQEFGLNNDEYANFIEFCKQFCSLLPELNQKFQNLCPLNVLGQKIGLSTNELSRCYQLMNIYEWNYKIVMNDLNNLIKEISMKMNKI